MKYPTLLEQHRQKLFEIIELAKQNGGVHQTFAVFWDMTNTCNFGGEIAGFSGKFQDLELKILDDCGYAKYIDLPSPNMHSFALTALALDYYEWWRRPRLYRRLSGWWASLEGEVKGVIIALVVPPLAGMLFELARCIVGGVLRPK